MTSPNLTYYSDLLIRQYRSKPKARQTVELLANQAFCSDFPFGLQTCFGLDVAAGKQLDVIGRIVGVPRNVYTLDLTHKFFNLKRYGATVWTVYGLGRYTDDPYDPSGALFFRYNFSGSSQYGLLDSEMKLLIRLKIILNNSDSSFKTIKETMFQYFPGVIDVLDNKDMSLTYNIKASLSAIAQAAVTLGLLPRPMGVRLILNFS